MKLLINLCAHDGIISHYTGVGTMVKRYIKVIIKILEKEKIDYKLNLFTPQYHENSFGFSKETSELHKNLNIYQVSNGSNGEVNYGTIFNWQNLCENTASVINQMDFSSYDKILTISHDTPFACLQNDLIFNEKCISLWIPHSTIKIHEVDSAILGSEQFFQERLDWEHNAIDFINENKNSYLGGIGEFIKKHLCEEYQLLNSKIIDIFNGEIMEEKKQINYKTENELLFKQIKNYKEIILSFGRAEAYKNLTSPMILGDKMNIPTIVIAQSYYKEQPILKEYENIAKKTNANLFIDPPFDFPKYILENFKGNIILVIPSKKEIMGLIINEVRKMKKTNILSVANDIDGLKEQIVDEEDGLLVHLEDIDSAILKIKNNYNTEQMIRMSKNGYERLKKDYNFLENFKHFLIDLGVME